MNPFRLSLLQTDIHWEYPSRQLQMLDSLLPAAGETDFLLLPECFATGFSMNAKLAEHETEILEWMKENALKKGYALGGTVFSKTVTGQHVNRFWIILPDGKWYRYDKRHLFSYAGEDQHFSPGNKQILIAYKSVRIAPMICYDLRFPVWSRRSPDFNYDLLLYPANWPERRKTAWSSLLPARAIENQSYVAGVNRVGIDGKGISYSGDTAIWNFLGEPLASARAHATELIHAEIDLLALHQFREEFPFAKDADSFQLEF